MITWFAEARCDADAHSLSYKQCENKTEAVLTLKARRVIEIELPDEWTVHYRGNDDSQNDGARPDLDGDDVRVYCPAHRPAWRRR